MSYTRQDVERLLPAVWDEQFAWGLLDEQAADPDMPRGTVDPSHGHTLYAMLADIRTAWVRAHLTAEEKHAVELVARFECTGREAGVAMGTSKATAWRRWEDGVGRITNWLNGTDYEFDQTETE